MRRALRQRNGAMKDPNRTTERRRLRWRPCSVRGFRFLRCDLPTELGQGGLSLLIGPNAVGWWLTVAGPSSASSEELAATGERLEAYPTEDAAKAALGGIFGVRMGARHEPWVSR